MPRGGTVRVTPRAVLAGVLSTALLVSVTPYNDLYIGGTYVAGNHLPIGAFGVLLLFALVVNPCLRWWPRGRPFSSGELLTVWVMTLVSSGVPSSGLFRYVLACVIAPHYFATPENEWARLLHPHLSPWLTPIDPAVVRGFYEGAESVPWAGWLRPILFWTPLLLLFYCAMFCMCAVLRRQWVEHERFTFPLMTAPMEVAVGPLPGRSLNGFLRNRWMWAGCCIPVAIHTLNGLHTYFPAAPHVPMSFPLRPLFSEEPWTPFGNLVAMIFPSVIGVSYLVTQEVAFSFWFFHLMYRAQDVAIHATGFPISGGTMARHQELGAYLAGCCFVVWVARGHLRRVWAAFLRAAEASDDGREAMPFRWAVAGLIVSTAATAGMLAVVGMSYVAALVMILLFYVLLIVVTWMVVDAGLLFVSTLVSPSDFVVPVLGTRPHGAADVVIPAIVERSLMWDSREFAMPSIMNGMRAPDAAGVHRRQVAAAMALALVVALAVGFVASLKLIYSRGAVNLQFWTFMMSAVEFPTRAVGYLNAPGPADWTNLSIMGGGALFMLFLCLMRFRFVWWPAHPIGYLAFSGYHMSNLWFVIFVGWMMKLIVLRLGGAHRQVRPVFLGLIVGDSIMAAAFLVVGLVTGTGYKFLPG